MLSEFATMVPVFHLEVDAIFTYKALLLVFDSFPDYTVFPGRIALQLLVYPMDSVLARHPFSFVAKRLGVRGMVRFRRACCRKRREGFVPNPRRAFTKRVNLKCVNRGVVESLF